MINIPEELKSRISIEDVISRYWEEPDRAHRIKCFAHTGKDRNMLVKNGFVYCFVCGARFDIIGAVQHLFGLSFIQACEKLNSDFNCGLPIGKKLTRFEIEKLKRAEAQRIAARQAAENRKRIENRIFIKVCDELHLQETLQDIFKPTASPQTHEFDEWDKMYGDSYINASKSIVRLNMIIDVLLGKQYPENEFDYTYGIDSKVIYDKIIAGEIELDRI